MIFKKVKGQYLTWGKKEAERRRLKETGTYCVVSSSLPFVWLLCELSCRENKGKDKNDNYKKRNIHKIVVYCWKNYHTDEKHDKIYSNDKHRGNYKIIYIMLSNVHFQIKQTFDTAVGYDNTSLLGLRTTQLDAFTNLRAYLPTLTVLLWDWHTVSSQRGKILNWSVNPLYVCNMESWNSVCIHIYCIYNKCHIATMELMVNKINLMECWKLFWVLSEFSMFCEISMF